MAKREAHHPAPFKPIDAYSLQALGRGEASDLQQKRALDWIIMATGVRDEVFVPGKPDVKDYLLGRRSIGLQIAHLLTWKPSEKSPDVER